MGIFKQKNSDNWYIDYYLPGGKRIREVAGTSKKLAEQLLGKRKAQILEGKFNVERPDAITFGEMVDKYLKYAKSELKASTYKRYESSKKAVLPCFGGIFMHNINALDLEKYKNDKLRELAPATVNRDLGFIRRVFSQGKKWGLVTKTPFEQVKLLRESNFRSRFLSIDEVKNLLKESQAIPHLLLAVSIALHTGMRRGEILSLCIPSPGDEMDKINWVDLERRQIHLNITKTGKPRSILINGTLYPIMSEAVKKAEGHTLFTIKEFKRSFASACDRAGIKNVVFHDLRRTFISHAMMAGYSQEVIQRVVGQDDPEIFKRYAYLTPDLKNQVVEEVGKIFQYSGGIVE